MESRKFRLIGILIMITLTLTVSVQAYRNYQNYQVNQRQLQNEILLSLDNSVEKYYTEIARADVFPFNNDKKDDILFSQKLQFQAITPSAEASLDSLKGKSLKLMQENDPGKSKINPYLPMDNPPGANPIFITTVIDSLQGPHPENIKSMKVIKGSKFTDRHYIQQLSNRIIFSMTQDTLDFEMLNEYLKEELNRQKININYGLIHYHQDSIFGAYNQEDLKGLPFKTVSKSTFLPSSQRLEMHFENSALAIVQRGITDLIISFLFLIVIGGSLWYLYGTIKSQKELAEIKNDLINNITHEFKTPIATVTSALEGIEHFNATNDPQKTRKYLTLSNQQLFKLNTMVEKLLETATLDSEQLMLQKEHTDPLPIISQLAEKYQIMNPAKTITLKSQENISTILADPFHLENAISNILDNAIKYGGDEITIKVSQNSITEISISDNGGNIHSGQKDKVFDKFYRIPKGNVHDVKGFGIGLYYTKKIIEKHGGNIHLLLSPGTTSFKITLV